jgi:beta-lactam-binding protein with PASTA domain
MATMPNVVGLEYPDALKALVTAGARVLPLGYFQIDPVTLTWVKSATTKPAFVIAQSPANGQSIAANAAVQLTVSSLPVSVAYPAGGTNV